MKYTLCCLLAIGAIKSRAQKHEINLVLLNQNNSKLNISSRNTTFNQSINEQTKVNSLLYALGYTYITKKNLEFSIQGGMGNNKSATDYRVEQGNYIDWVNITQTQQWTYIGLFIGKRYQAGKLLLHLQAGIPLTLYQDKDIKGSYISKNTSTSSESGLTEHYTAPRYYKFGIAVNGFISYPLYKTLYATLGINTTQSWQIFKGDITANFTEKDPGSGTISYSETQTVNHRQSFFGFQPVVGLRIVL